MPRDWMDEARARGHRREAWDDRHPRRDLASDDFGQADFSTDFAYDPDRRTAYRASDVVARRADDYGQADYSDDYAYDADHGRAYRRFSEDDRDYDRRADDAYHGRLEADEARREQSRSWADRAGAFFSGREDRRPYRRRGPSDRVLWAVIVERLESERGLDLRDVEVLVDDAEVTLNGSVRRKADKRRIEDICDLDGVRHVQNNLRARDAGRRWL